MKKDKKGKFIPSYTEEQFNLLVNLIRTADPERVYEYLDELVQDERTKWRTFKKAVSKARTIDNG